jgi:putative glutamine amidotransferase
MGKPIIGITTGLSGETQSVGCHYTDAVERAGGCPLMLPMPTRRETLEPVAALIDGLIITGGPGIADGLIGELPEDLPAVDERRRQADSWAFELARERGRPVLGICYGMQFINARMGGRIYADVQRQLEVGGHTTGRNGGEPVEHEVEVMGGSVLAESVGEGQIQVNSFHIQAVEAIGAGLRVSARSLDGLVEGVESEDGLLVGVQFHPERLVGTVWEKLFEYFVERAGG